MYSTDSKSVGKVGIMTTIQEKRFKLGKWIYSFTRTQNPLTPIIGYSSRCKDGKHILLWECDNISKDLFLLEYNNLLKLNPNIMLTFMTNETVEEGLITGSYHIIILDKFYFREMESILYTTHCDKIWLKLLNHSAYRCLVLRFTNKAKRSAPKLLDVYINKKPTKRKCSKAHYNLIKTIYPKLARHKIKHIPFDKSREVTITYYNTASKITLNGGV